MDMGNYLITIWHKLSGFLVKALRKIFFVYEYPREEIMHQRYYFYNYFLRVQNGLILRLKSLSLSGFDNMPEDGTDDLSCYYKRLVIVPLSRLPNFIFKNNLLLCHVPFQKISIKSCFPSLFPSSLHSKVCNF